MYKYILEREPAKFLETIPKKEKQRIISEIESLTQDPTRNGVIKLSGRYPAEYRTRQGIYRIVFTIDNGIYIIKVIRIFTRGSGY